MGAVRKRIFAGVAGTAVVIGIAVAAGAATRSTDSAPATAPQVQVAATATTPAKSACTSCSVPSKAVTTPAMTSSQEQAVLSAQGYLGDGTGFSRADLLDQLTSSYGSGFSLPDAEFAISYLNPDWNAQAVLSARGYLADGTGFSHDSLLDQLTSPYGSGFTQAQAEYALRQVGL